MRKKIFFLLLLFCSLFVGCDNDMGGYLLSEKQISFVTFNARMTDDLPLKSKRFSKMKYLFAESGGDILCIQDLYGDKTLEETKKMLKNRYGYDYSLYVKTANKDKDLEFIPEETIEAACSMNDIAPVISCVMENCPDYDAGCIVKNCWSDFLELPKDCRNCMLSGGIEAISGGDYLEILAKCQEPTTIPAKKLEYEFSGNNGILLASKLPMSNKTPIKLRSYNRLRMALAADVRKAGIGKIQVICTGLSPLSDEDYGGFDESWEEEQLTQVKQILEIPVKEDVVQRVILGDFNGNFAGGENIEENNSAPLALIAEEGWHDPYFDVGDDSELDCTVCRENPFVPDSFKGAVPDHIFFEKKEGFKFLSRRVFFNEFIDLNKEAGSKVTYSVSDHYGIFSKMQVDDGD